MQTYPIAPEERLPSGRTRKNTRAIGTGKIRPPMRGEWYLSGAIVEAYRAPNDLSTNYEIAELVDAPSIDSAGILEALARRMQGCVDDYRTGMDRTQLMRAFALGRMMEIKADADRVEPGQRVVDVPGFWLDHCEKLGV